MKKNMGNLDKGIRLVIVITIALLYFNNIIEGSLGLVLLALAVISLITTFIGFCPLYTLLGINTCKTKN